MSSNAFDLQVPATEVQIAEAISVSDPDTADNDSLADMAAVELLHILAASINGPTPTVTINNYDNARRFCKAAMLAVFEGSQSEDTHVSGSSKKSAVAAKSGGRLSIKWMPHPDHVVGDPP